MYPLLAIDGIPASVIDVDSNAPSAVTLNFGPDGDALCRACGDLLTETADGWADREENRECGDNAEHGPDPAPLSWRNSASIRPDIDSDAVTVTISVGDPRGAFCFTLRQIPTDVEGRLAGRLVMHTPYPGEPMPHLRVNERDPGTYVIGY